MLQQHNLNQQQQLSLQQQQHNLNFNTVHSPKIESNPAINQNYNTPKTNDRLIEAQSDDALQCLVNVAAAQQSIAIPGKTNQNESKKTADLNNAKSQSGIKLDQLNNNQNNQMQQRKSLMKIPQNLFSQEKFEKEFRHQDQLTKKSSPKPTPVINLEQSDSKQSNKKVKSEILDNEASKIFSDSFQKDKNSTNLTTTGMTASSLIDAIITYQINQDSSTNRPGSAMNKIKQDQINNQIVNQLSKMDDGKLNKTEDNNKKSPIKQLPQQNTTAPLNQISSKSDFGLPLPNFNHSAFANVTASNASSSISSNISPSSNSNINYNNSKKPNETNVESSKNLIVDQAKKTGEQSNNKNVNTINNIQFDYVGTKIFETMKKETASTNEKEITSKSLNASVQSSKNTAVTTSPTISTINSPTNNTSNSIVTTTTSKTTTDKLIGPSMPLLVSNKKPIKSNQSNEKMTDLNKSSSSNLSTSSNKVKEQTNKFDANNKTIDELKKSIKRPIDNVVTENKSLDNLNTNSKKVKLQESSSSQQSEPKKKSEQQSNNSCESGEKIDKEDVDNKLSTCTTSSIDSKSKQTTDEEKKQQAEGNKMVIEENKNDENVPIVESKNSKELIKDDESKIELTATFNNCNSKEEQNYLNSNNEIDCDLYSSASTPGEMVIDESFSSQPNSPIQQSEDDRKIETNFENGEKNIIKNETKNIISSSNVNLPFSSSALNADLKIDSLSSEIKQKNNELPIKSNFPVNLSNLSSSNSSEREELKDSPISDEIIDKNIDEDKKESTIVIDASNKLSNKTDQNLIIAPSIPSSINSNTNCIASNVDSKENGNEKDKKN